MKPVINHGDNLKPAATRAVPSLRWWIGGILFASTVINYVDRQTLSLLAPYLKTEYGWTNTDYANIVIAFRVAYSIGQTVFGRVMDRMGTRRGLTLTVVWSHWHSTWINLYRRLVFACVHCDLLGARSIQLCWIPVYARRRRIRKLAGRY